MAKGRGKKRVPPNDLQRTARSFVRWLINGEGKPDLPVTPPAKGSEAWYRDRLAEQLGGKTEVVTPNGRIDILTKAEVIEVKAINDWKHALGQVLVYGQSYPKHALRIHLYGQATEKKLQRIREQCKRHGVTIS